jgi:F420-dependent oxidoreductase-like protein
VTIRLGLQIPNFSYGTGVAEMFPTVVAQAREAEEAGFDAVFLMDHFYQLPMLGAPDQPMLEAYTALGALAGATERVALGTLVTGNTYRNPALLAKTVTTLDVVSAGRAVLGIGTGWFELEHTSLGFEFGTFTERFAKLDEALQIILPMIAGESVSFSGEHYSTVDAVAVPRYRDHIPLMIGGSGERKTFGLAARHFDHLNVIAPFEELPAKMAALDRRCEEAGRDRSTLETSVLLTVVPDPALDEDLIPPAMRGRMAVGAPRQIAEAVGDNVVQAGIDGVIVNLPRYVPGSITAVAEALRPVVGS